MTEVQRGGVTVSIVSHGHCGMLRRLLMQLEDSSDTVQHVIVTHNIPSSVCIKDNNYCFDVTVIENQKPQGFGANHNQAFLHCDTEFYCILNPDIEIIEDPFPDLIRHLGDPSAGIVAPTVLNGEARVEDSYRKFPTPLAILKKLVLKDLGIYKSDTDQQTISPDWVAGMFILIRADLFELLNGFDEAYFLYYEDIDICLRSWRLQHAVLVSRNVSVIHHARRDSHVKLSYLTVHLKSMLLFFAKHWLRFPR